LVALAGVGVVAAAVWRGRSAALPSDQLRVRDAAADRRRHADAAAAGSTPRRLECTGINFSYGDLQVLFDVDFTIDDGEVVALLGTNGAGKSTLLNVISGIGLPQSGVVRLDGQDITYLDAEDRVRRGLTQIPGGRAVFGSMTVIDNLRTYGYTLGRDRHAIDEAVERCLEAFPQLALRQSSLAATLSGGEQQMVGLSKALILRPRLLLIDELSLGLAPTTLRPLLDMVRRINSEGTALVIVEQSVNIALSLVDHAYFMEKGTMRFNGRAADLLERHDLLRAVFLEGAAKDALS
jgi:ABC-type branched-subunit amino acid transport system ATPase component